MLIYITYKVYINNRTYEHIYNNRIYIIILIIETDNNKI